MNSIALRTTQIAFAIFYVLIVIGQIDLDSFFFLSLYYAPHSYIEQTPTIELCVKYNQKRQTHTSPCRVCAKIT